MRQRKSGKELRLTHRIHTRITKQKYDELTDIINRSRGIRSHSELLRYILDNKQIQLSIYDATYDRVLEELSSIRTQLRSIGVNVNQVVRRLHSTKISEGGIPLIGELSMLYQESDKKMNELFVIVSKISEQWLPE